MIPPFILAVSLLGFYLGTIAPGLTWANGGSDGGDLITAAATGGIAHPTGYPLYLILARLFQFIPVGSLAFRTNLMSVVFTVLAGLLVYAIVIRAFSPARSVQIMLTGMCAGYCFGLAPVVWSQAVITEVYALQAFLIALIVYLYSYPELPTKRMDRLRGLVLGLAMGNHITTVFIVPVAVFLGSMIKRADASISEQHGLDKITLDGAAFKRQLVWFTLGLCIYLTIPLRALAQPPINWGNPVTPERFWWLVSGELYQSYYLHTSVPSLWQQIQASAWLLLQQIGIPGLVFGLTGIIVYGEFSRLNLLTVWIAIVSLFFTFFYRPVDSYIYLIPMFISFAIWMGLGVGKLINQFSERFYILGLGISLLLIGYFLARSISYVSQVNASRDYQAETFGKEVLAAVPVNAIIFAKGDRAIFTLWYYHFALQQRTDLIVLAAELLHFDWYQEAIRATYPSLSIPGAFPWPETITSANPLRATCQVQYTEHAEIRCIEPLMAP